jgi:hypothetical protein
MLIIVLENYFIEMQFLEKTVSEDSVVPRRALPRFRHRVANLQNTKHLLLKLIHRLSDNSFETDRDS